MAARLFVFSLAAVLFLETHAVSLKLTMLQVAHEKCLPTAVERGPCHTCVCTEHGYYNCVRLYGDRTCDDSHGSPEMVCQANQRYVEGNLICTCSKHRQWVSVTCQNTFRYLKSMNHMRKNIADITEHTNFSCTPDHHYLVECNLCLCPKSGRMDPEHCTKRHCKTGTKAEPCKPGQFLRMPEEICSCSETGFYIDRLCVKVANFRIQKVAESDLAIITDTSPLRSDLKGNETCIQNQIYQADCNLCRCQNGMFVCTSKLCGVKLPDKIEDLTRAKLPKNHVELDSKRALRTMQKVPEELPELKTLDDKCEPGKRYKYKCNKCTCSAKAIPVCTTMLCVGVDFSNLPKET